MENYIINYETLLIIPYGEDKSFVYEVNDSFEVDSNVLKIVQNSCLFFGSSLAGRNEAVVNLLDSKIKLPIIVENTKNLLIFPTYAHKNKSNIWISYNNLIDYKKSGNGTLLKFIGNNDINIDVKSNIIDNQIIRCVKLDAILNKRKQKLKIDSDFY